MMCMFGVVKIYIRKKIVETWIKLDVRTVLYHQENCSSVTGNKT